MLTNSQGRKVATRSRHGVLHDFLKHPLGSRGHDPRHHEELTTQGAFDGDASTKRGGNRRGRPSGPSLRRRTPIQSRSPASCPGARSCREHESNLSATRRLGAHLAKRQTTPISLTGAASKMAFESRSGQVGRRAKVAGARWPTTPTSPVPQTSSGGTHDLGSPRLATTRSHGPTTSASPTSAPAATPRSRRAAPPSSSSAPSDPPPASPLAPAARRRAGARRASRGSCS